MPLKLKVITASTRPKRSGPAISDWVVEVALAHAAFDVELVDLAAINLPMLDEVAHPMMQRYEHDHTKHWSAIIDDADAIIFVTPEYDFFAPASLVNAVQCLMREWFYKPVGVVSYGGVSGGLRASQVVRQLLGNVGAYPIAQGVPVPFFIAQMSEEGRFTPNEKESEGAAIMFAELAKLAPVLKPLHSNERPAG